EEVDPGVKPKASKILARQNLRRSQAREIIVPIQRIRLRLHRNRIVVMNRSEHDSWRKSSDGSSGPDPQVLIHHAWAGVGHGGGTQNAEGVGASKDVGVSAKC